MLLNHARLPARLDSEGRIVTLDRQDRGLWDTREIAEGVRVLQSALAMLSGPGRYQIEAAIAALHDDAASAEETDWPQILAWYDDLVALTDDPVRQDPAAVLGPRGRGRPRPRSAAGLRETDRLREVLGDRHRWHAVRGHLHELDGDLPAAATRHTPRPPAGPRRRRARPPGPPGRPRDGVLRGPRTRAAGRGVGRRRLGGPHRGARGRPGGLRMMETRTATDGSSW